MPELPEVETTLNGISPFVVNKKILGVEIRNHSFRWPVNKNLGNILKDQKCAKAFRRGKYLLLKFPKGHLILHLGMSGSLRITDQDTPPQIHDHVDFILPEKKVLRFRDPRRFGCVLWTREAPEIHPLLKKLGPEPLGQNFSGTYLHEKAKGRTVAVKNLIMNSQVVVGVGNIYANEALFFAGIHPGRKAGRVSKKRYEVLALTIKEVLSDAIQKGGTTLKDFSNASGNPGYFQLRLAVYGKKNQPCQTCTQLIKSTRKGNRSTFFCSNCQT